MKSDGKEAAAGPQRCRRCGRCCQQGGPALHHEDQPLLEEGWIKLASLYTIRRGEPARDNVRGGIVPVSEDIIKVKSRPGTSTCLYYQDADCSCGIYEQRPAECRVLKCWDTSEFLAMYDKNRLGRQYLLSAKPALWTLVRDHQQECDYDKIARLVKTGDKEQLAHLVRYDGHIRKLVVEKLGLDANVLDFLLGMPLSVTIRRYGLQPADMGMGAPRRTLNAYF